MIKITYNGVPPTINSCYATRVIKRMTKKGLRHVPIRHPSESMDLFKNDFKMRAKVHGDLEPFKKEVLELQTPLVMVIELWFHKQRFYCLNGRIKSFDSTNRVKVLEDSVVKLIGIDDKFFFRSTVEKKITETEERVEVYIFKRS